MSKRFTVRNGTCDTCGAGKNSKCSRACETARVEKERAEVMAYREPTYLQYEDDWLDEYEALMDSD